MGWEVGYLALCVKVGPWRHITPNGQIRKASGPNPGQIYCVTGIQNDWRGFTCLEFEGFAAGRDIYGYRATRFRKITPGAKIEGVEERRRLPVRQDA